jgi:hypothetical protein
LKRLQNFRFEAFLHGGFLPLVANRSGFCGISVGFSHI